MKQQSKTEIRKWESVPETLRTLLLLAKLAAGDMVAIETKYHNKCLCALYNKARKALPQDDDGEEDHLHGIVSAE